MNSRNLLKIFGVVGLAALALSACRTDEQGRITQYKPGVYLGKQDAQLSENQQDQLRQRALMQGGSGFAPAGGQAR